MSELRSQTGNVIWAWQRFSGCIGWLLWLSPSSVSSYKTIHIICSPGRCNQARNGSIAARLQLHESVDDSSLQEEWITCIVFIRHLFRMRQTERLIACAGPIDWQGWLAAIAQTHSKQNVSHLATGSCVIAAHWMVATPSCQLVISPVAVIVPSSSFPCRLHGAIKVDKSDLFVPQ